MKKKDELKELRGLGEAELSERAGGVEEELMKLRFRHASGQLEKTSELVILRRRIARIKTVLDEKKKAAANTVPAS